MQTTLTLAQAESRLITATMAAVVLGKPRHVAFREACKADPQAHEALVVGHNLKHGRKRQAARFREDFEHSQPDEE